MGFIYKIISPSKRVYVGKTFDLAKRIRAHKSSAKRQRKDILLHNSIRKYGWEAHVLEVIEECPDELMNEREIFWITELKTYCYEHPNGMNMTKGGEGQRSTWMHKTELRKWYSEKFSGDGNPFYGKKHSEESKEIVSRKATKRHLERGTLIPEWGVEKGRQKIRKPVVCYSSDGSFLYEFHSITEASQKLNVNHGSAKDSVLYGSWIDGKYLLKYKTDNYPSKIDVGKIKKKTVRRPIYWLSEDLEPICEFPSALEASEFFGIPKTTINRAAQYNNLNPIRTGHVFCYKDEYLPEYSLAS